MEILECVCLLLSQRDYKFPVGEYRIKISDKKYRLNCKEVVLFDKNYFKVNEELKEFYKSIESNAKYFSQRFPYYNERGVLLFSEYFTSFLKDYCKTEEMETRIKVMTNSYFCIYIIFEYDYQGAEENILDYINKMNEEKNEKKVKPIFYSV